MSVTNELRTKIERHIRRAIIDDPSSRLCLLELHHCPQGARPTLVFKRPFDEDDGGLQLEYLEPMVGELIQRLTDDASGMGGIQRYQLSCFAGDGKPLGRLMLRVQGYDETLDGFGDSEEPNARGLIAQQMRHNEALAKSSHVAFGQIITTQQHMVNKMGDMLEKLMEQRLEQFETIEEARSQRHERELEMLREQDKHEFRARLMDKADLLLPAVVNKLAGKKVMPGESPQLDSLREFIHSIEPAQLQALQSAGILSYEQQVALFTLIQSFASDDDDESPQDSSRKQLTQ